MLRTGLLLAALVLSIGGSTSAQAVPGQIGFFASGGGRSAGTTCSGFTCRSALLVGKPNVRIDLTVRATKNAPFFVVFGARTSLCQSIPGFVNSLAIPPLFVASGIVNTPDPGVNCTGFRSAFSITIPGSVRKGAQLALQALAIVKDTKGVPRPTFSSPIDIVVL